MRKLYRGSSNYEVINHVQNHVYCSFSKKVLERAYTERKIEWKSRREREKRGKGKREKEQKKETNKLIQEDKKRDETKGEGDGEETKGGGEKTRR